MATPSKEANSVAAVAACSAGGMTDAHWSSPGTGCSAPVESTCVALSDMKPSGVPPGIWRLDYLPPPIPSQQTQRQGCLTLLQGLIDRQSCRLQVRQDLYPTYTYLAGRVFVAVAAVHLQCQAECDKLQVRGVLNRL